MKPQILFLLVVFAIIATAHAYPVSDDENVKFFKFKTLSIYKLSFKLDFNLNSFSCIYAGMMI